VENTQFIVGVEGARQLPSERTLHRRPGIFLPSLPLSLRLRRDGESAWNQQLRRPRREAPADLPPSPPLPSFPLFPLDPSWWQGRALRWVGTGAVRREIRGPIGQASSASYRSFTLPSSFPPLFPFFFFPFFYVEVMPDLRRGKEDHRWIED